MTELRQNLRERVLRLVALACLATCAYVPDTASAQASPATESPSKEAVLNDGTTEVGPPQRGFFASMSSSVAHDSVSGWSTVASPSLSYHFTEDLSVDASVPYFLYLNAVKTTKDGATRLIGHTGAIGDMASLPTFT